MILRTCEIEINRNMFPLFGWIYSFIPGRCYEGPGKTHADSWNFSLRERNENDVKFSLRASFKRQWEEREIMQMLT